VSFEDDFLRGQNDCSDGKDHQPGQGNAYDRGYATQYEAEAAADWATLEMGLEVDCGSK